MEPTFNQELADNILALTEAVADFAEIYRLDEVEDNKQDEFKRLLGNTVHGLDELIDDFHLERKTDEEVKVQIESVNSTYEELVRLVNPRLVAVRNGVH